MTWMIAAILAWTLNGLFIWLLYRAQRRTAELEDEVRRCRHRAEPWNANREEMP